MAQEHNPDDYPLDNSFAQSAQFASAEPHSAAPWKRKIGKAAQTGAFLAISLQALGVIFGDVGTSPLYVMKSIFTAAPSNPDDYIAGCSLVLWSILLLVLVKYCGFLLSASNEGEGGMFAIGSLLVSKNSRLGGNAKIVVRVFMTMASTFLLSDGAFTPAISVLSAVGGIALYAKELAVWVVPIAVVLLVLLFFVQRFGTARIGIVFGPLMLVWFSVLFIIGCWRLSFEPRALLAFNPYLRTIRKN